MPSTTAERGRDAIIDAVVEAASAGIERPWDPHAVQARASWAAHHLGNVASDDFLTYAACDAMGRHTLRLAGLPAVGAGGMAYKLARLTAELLQDFDGYPHSVGCLALAASALADAVVLGSGPITLPEGAAEGVQEGSAATAQAGADRAGGGRAGGAAPR